MVSLLNCESTESDSQELMFRVRSFNLRVELLRLLGLTAIDSRLVCVITTIQFCGREGVGLAYRR